jgi:hypothetical protein
MVIQIWTPSLDSQEIFLDMYSPFHIKRNYYKLVELVEVVEYCIGREFDEDVKSFEQEYYLLPVQNRRGTYRERQISGWIPLLPV